MNMIKGTIAAAMIGVIALSFFGCSNTQTEQDTPSQTDFTLTSVSEALDRSSIFTERDISASFDESVYTITLKNGETQSSCDSVNIDGDTITITDTGTYTISGTLDDGKICVLADDDDKIQLVLNNTQITNKSDSAIYVENAKKVFVTANEGTTNTLINAGEFTGESADGVIYSKDDLTLNGSGILNISTQYGHGIVCNDDLKICTSNITVNAKNHAVKANNSISVSGAELELISGEDALHCANDENEEKGCIYFTGSTVLINAQDDAIHSSNYIVIDDGKTDIQSCYEGLEAPKIEINGGEVYVVSTDDGFNASSGNSSDSDFQQKRDGFEATGSEGFDAQSGATSDGTQSERPTPPDKKTNMQKPDSTEQGQFDKGNKMGMADTNEDCHIIISGGTVSINADGDGLDSNGYLLQTGGDVTVYGPENSGNGAIDYGIASKITGGTIVAFGMSGMAQSFDDCSTQGSILVVFDEETSGEFSLKSSLGKDLITRECTKKYNCVTVSTPDIQPGNSYTLKSGEQSKKIKMNSITYKDSSAATGGKINRGAKNFNEAKDFNREQEQ